MRTKSLLWVSVLAVLAGSLQMGTDTLAAQAQSQRSREIRNSDPDRENLWREYLRDRNERFKDYQRATREEREEFERYLRERAADRRDMEQERDRAWREYLREQKKAYRDYARATRQEREQFERYLRNLERERDREWREYLRERNRAYKDYLRATRPERDDFDRWRTRNRDDNRDGRWGGNVPRNGVCFFTDADYRGDSFCAGKNESMDYVGGRYNDRISSIRVFGNARVIVYEHDNFDGDRHLITRDVPNLAGKFNDKISSFQVQ